MSRFSRTFVRKFSSSTVVPQLQTEQLVEQYLARPTHRLKLSSLVSLGRPLTSESLLSSVDYAFEEIPRRLATRVRSLENLPFIVGMNPFISRVLETHGSSFHRLATHPPVTNLQENIQFTAELEKMIAAHSNDIPQMAKGLQECSRYMSPEEVSAFLDGAIRNRIAVRLIAEQHVALSHALDNPDWKDDRVGVIDMKCKPADLIRTCGSFVTELCTATMGMSPEIIIDGDPDATFAYVPVHLEYILTEILKNAFRATVEKHNNLYGSSAPEILPPVVITISSTLSSPTDGPFFLSMRIRDEGGGVSRANMARIFSYAFTTAGSELQEDGNEGGPYAAQHVGGSAAIDEADGGDGDLFGEITRKGMQAGLGTLFGLGYGLPMSRLYAQYFGGSLHFLSLDGWGSDIFLKLPSLDVVGDVQI